MIRAEHSPQEHSAPHGASQAALLSLSNSRRAACQSAPSVSQISPFFSDGSFTSRRFLVRLSQRRFASSGRTLLALLTLGLALNAAPSAQAAPPSAGRASAGRSLSPTMPAPSLVMTSSKAVPAITAPRAALMPRSTAFAAPQSANANSMAAKKIATKSQMGRATTKIASVTVGGGKMIRLAQLQEPTQGVASRVATSAVASVAPATIASGSVQSTTLAPAKPSALPADLGGMRKVINVPTLSLPPLSKPLPKWMQNAAVKVDKLDRKGSTRLAQNPTAPPLRNPGTPVTNSDRLANQIEVAVSTFVVLLTTTDLQTVAVADPGVADVAVVNSRSVLLNGKSAGVTSLVIVDGQKIRQYTVRVTPAPGSRPVDVATAIGLPGVTVRPLRDALVLEGEVASGEEARRAAEIAGIYSTRVINQLTIRGQVSQEAGTAAQIQSLINLPNVTVRVSGDTAILSGTVDSPQQIQDADVIARTAAKNVINLLRLPALTPDQVRQSLGAVAEAPAFGLPTPGQLATASPLSVREAGGQIIIEGTVGSQSEADIALAAANRTGLPVVNRVQIRAAATADQALASQVAAAIGRPGVIVRGTPKRLVLEGVVADTNEAVLAEQVARGFTLQVDNLLRTRTPVQCNVDVSIIEINSTDARNLGVEYGSATLLSESFDPGSITTNPTTGVTTGVPPRTTRNIDPTFRQGVGLVGRRFGGVGATQILDPLLYRINALATAGKARVLSNPRTTVLSGRTATFQVGGQVPIPASSTVGANGATTSIVFKDFGVLLDIVPQALPNGNVTVRIRTEVSQPDFGVGVTPPGGGSPIPGFRRRSSVTEVTVPVNGTVALSGLISADEALTDSSVPILSRIPIIGSLFRSKNFRNNQSELVIFVRPRVLPNPLAADTEAFAGVVAVGENTNVAAQMGNPGLRVFDAGNALTSPAAGQ